MPLHAKCEMLKGTSNTAWAQVEWQDLLIAKLYWEESPHLFPCKEVRGYLTFIAARTDEMAGPPWLWHAAPADAASCEDSCASSAEADTPLIEMLSVFGSCSAGSAGPLNRTRS
jgi:hypothetical protein